MGVVALGYVLELPRDDRESLAVQDVKAKKRP
jgi:hypothetical protein